MATEFFFLQRGRRGSLYPIYIGLVLAIMFSAIDISIPTLGKVAGFKNQVAIAVKNLQVIKIGVYIIPLRSPHFIETISIGGEAVGDVE